MAIYFAVLIWIGVRVARAGRGEGVVVFASPFGPWNWFQWTSLISRALAMAGESEKAMTTIRNSFARFMMFISIRLD